MIYDRRRRLILPDRFSPRKKQRGSIMLAMFAGADRGLILSPSTANVTASEADPLDAYAGIEFRSDGSEWMADDSSSAYDTSRGNWLDRGDAADVWIQWTRTGGSLGDWNSEDSGDARLQMNANHAWRIARTTAGGPDTLIGNFTFWDAASGGNQLATTGDRTFTVLVTP